MGQIFSCCKPKKIQYNKINGQEKPKTSIDSQIDDVFDKRAYHQNLLTKVSEIVNVTLKASDGACSRTFGDIFHLNYETIDQDLAELPNDFQLVDEVISDEELEYILNSCSNSPQSQVVDVDMESPNTNSASFVENLLENNEHIKLCQSSDDVAKLMELLTLATQHHLIGDYIDNVDCNGNTAVAVALMSSNDVALLSLVMTFMADIPLYINAEGHQYLFLNYLVYHNRRGIAASNPRRCFLYIILKEISKRSTDEEYLRKYLKAIDPNFYFDALFLFQSGLEIFTTLKLSLLHFLIELYLMRQSRTTQIYDCIILCIKIFPESLYTTCQVNRHTNFDLNVICRILCCANMTNIKDVVEILKQIREIYPQIINDGLQLYNQIIGAHSTMDIRNELTPLFT